MIRYGNPPGDASRSQPPGIYPNFMTPSYIVSPAPELDYSDFGFRKSIVFLRSPPVGASFIALTLFFLIVFITNTLFNSASLLTLGIIVTLSALAFMGLIILILFLF